MGRNKTLPGFSERWFVHWTHGRTIHDVSINRGSPKSSMLIGFSLGNHPAIGVAPFYGHLQILTFVHHIGQMYRCVCWPGCHLIYFSYQLQPESTGSSPNELERFKLIFWHPSMVNPGFLINPLDFFSTASPFCSSHDTYIYIYLYIHINMFFSTPHHGSPMVLPCTLTSLSSYGQVLKVFDLADSNEFDFDAETLSKISLQCGNERVRLRGPPEQMRRWCLGGVAGHLIHTYNISLKKSK